MKCRECKRVYRKNFYNKHKFSMDLCTKRTIGSTLDFEVISFFGSTDGSVCHSTFHLYLDKGKIEEDFGVGEKVLCEDVSINQLKRLYHFLDLVINKTVKE